MDQNPSLKELIYQTFPGCTIDTRKSPYNGVDLEIKFNFNGLDIVLVEYINFGRLSILGPERVWRDLSLQIFFKYLDLLEQKRKVGLEEDQFSN